MKIWRNAAVAGLITLGIISCQTQQGNEIRTLQSDVFETPPPKFDTEKSQPSLDDGFIEPWKDSTRAFVLDGRDFNFETIKWEELVKDKRVKGMIARATGPNTLHGCTPQSELSSEPNYDKIRDKAKSLNYLWGSYHVGLSEEIKSIKEQAKFYLETAQPKTDEVIALDLEDFDVDCYMNLEEAREFIQYIFEQTGRYPLVYVTGSILEKVVKNAPKDGGIFAKTPLWFVRNENNIKGCFKDSKRTWWRTYALWQFASEINCVDKGKTFCEEPKGRLTPCPFEQKPPATFVPKVPGVKNDMDIDIYNGTVEDLRKAWLTNFKVEK
jgi:hypothetical protein